MTTGQPSTSTTGQPSTSRASQAAETRSRILEAARRVLAEEGTDRFTTRRDVKAPRA